MHGRGTCVKISSSHQDIVHQVDPTYYNLLICKLCSFRCYVSYNENTFKEESGFPQVKCNKSKRGKSVLQLGILFVCIKLTFLIYLLPVISDCISILMMYKWNMFSVKSHGNFLKITLTYFFSYFYPAVILEGCTFLLLK